MIILRGWCWFAGATLLVSAAAHASTFLGIDPMEIVPGVMLIHIVIFPPFIAALVYAKRVGGGKDHQTQVMKQSPLWLRVMTGAFFAYAMINFAVFIFLTEGGVPRERDGKYILHSHGTVIRSLTEEEYHTHRAYVVRGFSGHWMLFSSAALMFLIGTARLRAAQLDPVRPSD